MTARYASHVSTKTTPQSKKIPGSKQEKNNAGGFSHVLDSWKRLDRFLILGSDKSTYYVSEMKLTQDNAECVVKCGIEDGKRADKILVLEYENPEEYLLFSDMSKLEDIKINYFESDHTGLVKRCPRVWYKKRWVSSNV